MRHMRRVEELKAGDTFVMDGIEHSVIRARKTGDYVELTTGARISFLLPNAAMVWANPTNEES